MQAHVCVVCRKPDVGGPSDSLRVQWGVLECTVGTQRTHQCSLRASCARWRVVYVRRVRCYVRMVCARKTREGTGDRGVHGGERSVCIKGTTTNTLHVRCVPTVHTGARRTRYTLYWSDTYLYSS